MTARADALLSGPRGRRLCLALVFDPVVPGWPRLTWHDGPDGYPVGRLEPEAARWALAAAVDACDLTALAAAADPAALLPALQGTVDAARYWQEPDDADVLLADEELAAVLRPVAEAVVAATASRWWAEPLDATDQQAVLWEPADTTPRWRGTQPALTRWRERTRAEELGAARERPEDPRANWTGEWWSTPVTAELVRSTRTLPGLAGGGAAAPVQLVLAEDELGWQTAGTWAVTVPDWARVLEVTGPDDWVDLVQRYPLEVTASRRHDWWRVTGRSGRWAVPDWSAVARHHEAVHLTVEGYLGTAGRALPVDVPGAPARTVLAGWDPDVTWWLTELDEPAGSRHWQRQDDEPPRWAPA